MKKFTTFLFPLVFLMVLGPAQFFEALAQEDSEQAAPAPIPEPKKFTTQHRARTVDGEIRYTATAEEIYLRDENGNPTASFFTISYTMDGVGDPKDRPVTFVFNGGPGSASLWLHLGLVGPKTIDIPSNAEDPGAPPYNLKDNTVTILRATDIVFVDPVGTGYSHALGEKKNEDFWGFDEDADSVAEFIRTFVTVHNRWNSPKYILGESYGGIRIGLLVPRLQQDLGIGLNGVIMIAPALNMATLPYFVQGQDISFVTQLPAYAATAWYHDRLPEKGNDFEAFLREVEDFAGNEFLSALFKGKSISPEEKERIAEKLHQYTGISKNYILAADLRMLSWRFRKELLRDQGLVVGRLDSRYTQEELDKVADSPDGDPFDAKTGSIYTALFQDYLSRTLGVDFSQKYLTVNGQANQNWKRSGQNSHAFAGFMDVADNLAQAAVDNGEFRIFAAAGYFDLATTYFAVRWTLERLGIDPERLENHAYHGGHMMYLYSPSREAVSNDIVEFIRGR